MLKIFDFKFYKENYLPILAFVISFVVIKFFNLVEILENSFLENIQLIALLGGFIACFFAKKNKTFFIFLAMLLFLFFMREISYGRVFVDETVVNFNKKLCHILVGIYIGAGILFALINKIWLDIINMIRNIKFPFWIFLISFSCVFIQLLSEKTLHNTCIEETAEFVLYSSILAIILIYIKK